MVKAILSRLVQSVCVIFFLITLTFFILHLLPGGPFDSENMVSPEVKARIEADYHLNESVWQQYVHYASDLARGSFGTSYRYLNEDNRTIIAQALPPTLELGLVSFFFAVLIAIPAGLVAARFEGQFFDRLILVITTVSLSAPLFLVAPILVLVFSFWLDLLPPALWDTPTSFILPVVTLSLRPMAEMIRLLRHSAIQTRRADFITAARAKGLGEKKLLFKHVLKNSAIPILGLTGPIVAHLLSGSFVVELLYAIPGLGHHFVDSVLDRDYPLILTLTLLYGVMLSLSTLASDIASAFLNPEVRSV